MPYDALIDRSNPGCIVFLVDLSSSMLDGIAGTPRAKMDTVSTAINRFFQELITSCEKGEEKPRNYFDVGLIGYTTDSNGVAIVRPLFQLGLEGRDLVSISELYDNPLEIERRRKKEFVDDGAGGLTEVEKEIAFPVWFRSPQPTEMFGTPMCTALGYCSQVVRAWIEAHPGSFPPMVINLTDDEHNESGRSGAAEELRSLATSAGGALLMTAHLSSRACDAVQFPLYAEQLPGDVARGLFEMTSKLPDEIQRAAGARGLDVRPGCRMMTFNADAVAVLKLLNFVLRLLLPAPQHPPLAVHLR